MKASNAPEAANGRVLLQGRGLSVTIRGRALLADLDFDVRAGEIWAIVGPNGAGKSMLLATLGGLRAPASGTVSYDGRPLAALTARERALHRGFLPQDTIDYFPASVAETVLIGRHPHLGRFRRESAHDFECAQTALAAMDLADLAFRDVATLSGGERRRVALAAIVAQDPALMLLDEPSSHLDLDAQVRALDAFAALTRERGKAIVMVLHDLHLALRYADHAIVIGGGTARAGAAAELFTAATLSALFGHALAEVGSGRHRTFVPE